jgi:2-keto-4-pentenoate hydratase
VDQPVDRLKLADTLAVEHGEVTELTEAPTPAGHRTAELAQRLHQARKTRELLDSQLEADALTLDRAYAVQDELTGLRLGEGRCLIGYKLGYTSAVMQRQMGVDAPNYGPLLDDMVRPGAAVAAGFLHPRVEPEIGIILSRDLSGEGLLLTDVADAVREVRACLEIVDSIWHGYRFTAEQNTADGSSAAGVVLGPILDVNPLHSHRISVELSEDDHLVATAVSAAAAGHPLQSVAWLAAALEARGQGLRKGELILTGGLTAAYPLRPGHALTARFAGRTVASVSRPASEIELD